MIFIGHQVSLILTSSHASDGVIVRFFKFQELPGIGFMSKVLNVIGWERNIYFGWCGAD